MKNSKIWNTNGTNNCWDLTKPKLNSKWLGELWRLEKANVVICLLCHFTMLFPVRRQATNWNLQSRHLAKKTVPTGPMERHSRLSQGYHNSSWNRSSFSCFLSFTQPIGEKSIKSDMWLHILRSVCQFCGEKIVKQGSREPPIVTSHADVPAER